MRHGTVSGYTHGCRCPECRTAKAASHRAYRQRLRVSQQCVECRRPAIDGKVRCAVHRERHNARYRKAAA